MHMTPGGAHAPRSRALHRGRRRQEGLSGRRSVPGRAAPDILKGEAAGPGGFTSPRLRCVDPAPGTSRTVTSRVRSQHSGPRMATVSCPAGQAAVIVPAGTTAGALPSARTSPAARCSPAVTAQLPVTAGGVLADRGACGPGSSLGRWQPVKRGLASSWRIPFLAADPPGQHVGRAGPAELAGALPAVTGPHLAGTPQGSPCWRYPEIP